MVYLSLSHLIKTRGPLHLITTFSQLLEIFAQGTGECAKQLRAKNARIRARAMAGDVDLVASIESQRANIPPLRVVVGQM
jgi:hypothetical protein